MPLTVIGVVLLAALCHASWNFLVKRADDPYLGMTTVVLGRVPFGILAVLLSPFVAPGAWPYIIIGALLHCGYQIFLLNSYRYGDLSQVYPMARGSAPLITAVVSILLLKEQYDGFQIAALFIIGAGIISLAFTGGGTSTGSRTGKKPLTALLAIITAGFISSYSVVDGVGARIGGTALGYYGCLTTINGIIFTGIIAAARPGITTRVLRHHILKALAGGGISFLAYSLVIWSFTMAPIALVAALRETSVIIALLLGVFVLKEKLTWLKACAVLLTLIGVILLRTG